MSDRSRKSALKQLIEQAQAAEYAFWNGLSEVEEALNDPERFEWTDGRPLWWRVSFQPSNLCHLCVAP